MVIVVFLKGELGLGLSGEKGERGDKGDRGKRGKKVCVFGMDFLLFSVVISSYLCQSCLFVCVCACTVVLPVFVCVFVCIPIKDAWLVFHH